LVLVAPYGANFNPENLPSRDEVIESHIHPDIRLLWIGVDWTRKGGAVAFDCLLSLLDRNFNASLTICGCTPPSRFHHPRAKVIPFLSKRDPKQRAQLSQLFLESTFLLFPTVNEAAAIVLCEASAHGLPSLATDTGGVGSVLDQGINGFLLPPNATGTQYADQVIAIFSDPASYRKTLEASRRLFDEKLNWDAWGRSARPFFERVAAKVTKESP
jgi:glycosyltransferase involved in cell wall biosynthesis